MVYENLLREAEQHGIDTYEKPMISKIKGLYSDKVIWINKHIPTQTEKACIIAEELGHYFTSVGNILDQNKIGNRKQEKLARTWAYEKLVPLSKIVQAHKIGIGSRNEFAEYLGVTEDFLDAAIKRYQEKFGTHVAVDGYTLCFDPLGVMEWFD
jgi:Zn-dependent peptidase ImmA (M78 family)